MGSRGRGCPDACNQSPAPQRRVISYRPTYSSGQSSYHPSSVTHWLQSTEPTGARPLGVELPDGTFLAWNSPIPVGEYQGEAYDSDASDDYEDEYGYEEEPVEQYSSPAPAQRYMEAPACVRGQYAKPIVVDTPAYDEDEEEEIELAQQTLLEAQKPPCCRGGQSGAKPSSYQQMRQRVREYQQRHPEYFQ